MTRIFLYGCRGLLALLMSALVTSCACFITVTRVDTSDEVDVRLDNCETGLDITPGDGL